MPDPQGLCDYGGYTNLIGGDYTESRGVKPGVFRLRMSAEPVFAKFEGTLKLFYNGLVREFEKCCNGPHVQRVYEGRQPYCWSVKVYDKRWKWRYPRISGHYNVRRCDKSVDPDTKKSLLDLILTLLEALGESNTTTRDIPDVFPEVHWQNAYAARELESLCDWAGLVICPQPNGVILIERLGSGQSLPVRNDNISPVYTYRQAVIPSSVELRTGRSIFQSLINLEAVGLDDDGTWRRINDLTYAPSGGWSSQWYTTFSGVPAASRHLAFQTVWRCYRLHSQAGSTDTSLETMKNLRILERLAESHPDDLGVGRCLDAVVKGIFWPLGDHKANTPDSMRYSGSFRVHPHLNLIWFDYPVIKWTAGLPDAATLKLYVAYNAVAPTGEYLDEVFSQSVPEAIVVTKPRVEKRPYLARVRNFDSPYGVSQSAADNLAEIQGEANGYLTNIAATYTGGPEVDMLYGGLVVPPVLSGKVAQIRYRWGNDRVATTRASENHEFDTTQKSHQQRRRDERLGQLWDFVKESQ